MDQVKAILAVMKKHHFWILIGVVALLGVGIWFTASAALAARYEARKAALSGQYSNVSALRSSSDHPNEGTIQQYDVLIGKNRIQVLKAWEVMYKDQQARNQWPKALSDNFRRTVPRLPREAKIPNPLLEEYMDFIKKHFPEMDMIIDRRRPKPIERLGLVPGAPAAAGYGVGYGAAAYGGGYQEGYGGDYGGDDGGGYGGEYGGATAMAGREMEGIVEWNDADYARVQAGVFWVERPYTVQVRLAQEDLWVYEALLRSIARTNAAVGATSYYNAAIKRIEALEIGQPAASAMKSAKSRLGLTQLLQGGAGGQYGDEYGEEDYSSEDYGDGQYGGGQDYGDYMEQGGMAAGPPTEESVGERLMRGRYVDLNGESLAADSNPYAEFKLMPVHIVVIMDQQRLPDFLVSLANSEMPVDVKQISIQASGKLPVSTGDGYGAGQYGGGGYEESDGGGYGGGGYGGGGYGGGGYGGGGYGGGYGASSQDDYDGEGGMGGYGMSGPAGAQTVGDEANRDIPIEIFGVIRIFNPPDMEKLGKGEVAEVAAPPADAPTMRLSAEQETAPPAGPEPAPGDAAEQGPGPAGNGGGAL